MNKRIKHILKLFIYHIGKILAKPQEKWLRAKNIFLNIDTVKKFKSCGTNFCIAPPFYLWYEQYMEIGDNFCSSPGLRMECIKEYNGTEYDAPQLIIGNNVSCNYYCHIGCLNKIVIGDNVMLGS